MQFLKADTAVKVVIGPFVDVDDGFTPETGITLGAADEAELVKHDSGTTTDISALTWAAITGPDGYYNLSLTATETSDEGMLTIVIQDDTVCLPVRATFMVLAKAAYDSMFTTKATGYMDVNVKAVSEDTTAADNLELACDNYSVTRGLTGTAVPAVAADGVGGLPISDAGGLDMDAILADTNELQADWTNTGRLDTILDSVLADTNELQADDTPTAIAAVQATADAIEVGTITNATGADVATDVVALKAETVNILADTNELQADWTNAGRLDTILDTIAADTTTDIPALIADVPTVAEFEARSIVSADYVVVGDTIAGVTLVGTTTDVTNEVSADAVKISGSAAAADNLEASAETIVVDTVDTGYVDTTTTIKGGGTATLAAADDHYNGRIIIFTSGILANQATDITDYDGTTKVFTFTALTSAPADGVSFVIV